MLTTYLFFSFFYFARYLSTGLLERVFYNGEKYLCFIYFFFTLYSLYWYKNCLNVYKLMIRWFMFLIWLFFILWDTAFYGLLLEPWCRHNTTGSKNTLISSLSLKKKKKRKTFFIIIWQVVICNLINFNFPLRERFFSCADWNKCYRNSWRLLRRFKKLIMSFRWRLWQHLSPNTCKNG